MGFFEILIIAVVALLVVGPERMPDAVRSAALHIGRLKRAVNNARSEIEQQVGVDEIRLQLHNEDVLEQIERADQAFAKSMANSQDDEEVDADKDKKSDTSESAKKNQEEYDEDDEQYDSASSQSTTQESKPPAS